MQAHKAAVREDMNGGAADMYWWCPTLYMCKPRSICQLANMLGHTRVLGSCVHTAVRSAAFWTLRTVCVWGHRGQGWGMVSPVLLPSYWPRLVIALFSNGKSKKVKKVKKGKKVFWAR